MISVSQPSSNLLYSHRNYKIQSKLSYLYLWMWQKQLYVSKQYTNSKVTWKLHILDCLKVVPAPQRCMNMLLALHSCFTRYIYLRAESRTGWNVLLSFLSHKISFALIKIYKNRILICHYQTCFIPDGVWGISVWRSVCCHFWQYFL